MIQITNVKVATPAYPSLQSELKPDSLYRDFEGDTHLVGNNNLLVGYFITRPAAAGIEGENSFVSNREVPTADISGYKLVPASATISFT